MTEEEMKQKIAEAEAKAAEAQKEIDDLKSQRSNQNSYITKLEGKVQGLENQMNSVKEATKAAPAIAPEITEYFQKKRREDYTEQAVSEIISQVGKEVYDCLAPELNNWLKLYMSEQNVSVRYIIDSFSLLYGRAMQNKEHPIHKIINPVKEETVKPEPVATDSEQESFKEGLRRMVNRTMTNDDVNAGGAPEVKPPTVQNTKEAMNAFKTRLFNLDSSKFE